MLYKSNIFYRFCNDWMWQKNLQLKQKVYEKWVRHYARQGLILESKGMQGVFQKKVKKGQNIWKLGCKFKKCDKILKKDSLICATIAYTKQLEYALPDALH